MSTLKVELVAADRKVWEGEATQVSARTTEGEIGVLPGHAPLLGVLAEGEIRIIDGAAVRTAVVDGGFVSVNRDTVTIVAEQVDATRMSL